MPRQPKRSQSARNLSETDIRTFFRSVRDPIMIAENRVAKAHISYRFPNTDHLSAEFVAREVRAAIFDLAERFWRSEGGQRFSETNERRYQGVVRCDLDNEPVKRVAADLGISVRQLQRERRAAHGRIISALNGQGQHLYAKACIPDLVGLEIDLGRRLLENGRSEQAIALLQSLANGGIPTASRVAVMAELAEALLETGLLADAVAIVESAQALVATIEDEAGSVRLRARLELATAGIERRLGNVTRWLQGEARALALIRGTDTSHSLSAAIIAIVLRERAARALTSGLWLQARSHIKALRGMISESKISDPMVLVDSLILESILDFSQSDDVSTGRATATRALELAQRHGLARKAALAGRHLAAAYHVSGDYRLARATALASVAVAVQAGDPTLLMNTSLGVADIELLLGNIEAATPYLESATSLAREGSMYWGQAHLRWADLLARQGRHKAALLHAAEARRTAESLQNKKLLGAALRRCAELQYELGDSAKATHTIREALDILRQYSTRYGLGLAYAASYRITGLPGRSSGASRELSSSNNGKSEAGDKKRTPRRPSS